MPYLDLSMDRPCPQCGRPVPRGTGSQPRVFCHKGCYHRYHAQQMRLGAPRQKVRASEGRCRPETAMAIVALLLDDPGVGNVYYASTSP